MNPSASAAPAVAAPAVIAQLQRGFLVGEDLLPWGTTLGQAAASYDRPVHHGRHLDLFDRAGMVGPIQVLDARLNAPHLSRPVLQASYGLGQALPLQDPAGLARVRAQLEAVLGPGQHAEHPQHGPPAATVAHTSRWALGPVEVTLSAWGALRQEDHAPTTGRLWLRADEELLAEPFLGPWHEPRPWQASPGIAIRYAVPGLWRADPHLAPSHVVLYRPWLLPAPPWLSLGPEEAAIWTHPDSGTWGIAAGSLTWAGPVDQQVTVVHTRWTPAKGPGSCDLHLRGGELLLQAGPGPAGLDALAARLTAMPGVKVRLEELPDC